MKKTKTKIRFIGDRKNNKLKHIVLMKAMGGINSYTDMLAYEMAMTGDMSCSVEKGAAVFKFENKKAVSEFLSNIA